MMQRKYNVLQYYYVHNSVQCVKYGGQNMNSRNVPRHCLMTKGNCVRRRVNSFLMAHWETILCWKLTR